MVRAGVGARFLHKLEPEPHKNGPAPQHWLKHIYGSSQKMELIVDKQYVAYSLEEQGVWYANISG
jgi:hypothetical protein